MSNEMIGILILGGGLAAFVVYWLHTEKGKAELAALEARLNLHTSTTIANAAPPAQAAPSPPPQVIVVSPSPTPAPTPLGGLQGMPGITVLPPAPAKPTYNAADYPQRGAGTAAWHAAGSPTTDSQGRALDVAGWPIAWAGMNAAQGLAMEAGGGPTPVPGDDPYNRPPYPTYWRFAANQPGRVSSLPFTTPAGGYQLVVENILDAIKYFVDGTQVQPQAMIQLAEGAHTAAVESEKAMWGGTMQLYKRS